MDRTQKLQFQRDVEVYLEEKRVYDIFEDLMKNLVISKPENPIDYMINKLSETEQKRIFIVGPPNSQVRQLSIDLSNHLKYTIVSVGDLLEKEISKKSDKAWKIQESVGKYQYIEDDLIIELVQNRIKELENEKENYILEGFPKTRVQGLALQKMGIIPDTFMIYNANDTKIQEYALQKLDRDTNQYYANIPKDQYTQYAQSYSQEYKLNIDQVKEIYPSNFFQIDDDNKESLEDMNRMVRFKIDANAPRRAQKIIVTGPPGSGRTTLAKALAKKYQFVYVSTRELIADQISKNTQVGKICLAKMNEGELVPDEIIKGLINSRIHQVDCHLKGYVLDGFPKSWFQLLGLEQLKINPTLIVILQCQDIECLQRLTSQKIDPYTGIIYNRNNMPNDKNINSRLIKAPNNNPTQVQNRNKTWKELLIKLESNTYSNLLLQVQAGDDSNPQNILETVSTHLEKKN